jgi:hypothetical protein
MPGGSVGQALGEFKFIQLFDLLDLLHSQKPIGWVTYATFRVFVFAVEEKTLEMVKQVAVSN